MFYTNLYTEEQTNSHPQQKLLDSIDRRLPTDISEILEGELDLNESYEALAETDGLSAEFYTLSWDVLGRDLVDVINVSNCQNLLVKLMRSAILTLAFKSKDSSDKNDSLYLKNWDLFSFLT